MIDKKTYEEALELMNQFEGMLQEFLVKANIPAQVNLTLRPTDPWNQSITIEEMIKVIDAQIMKSPRYSKGLKTRCRVRYLVIRRQIVCYIARKMHYPHHIIGDALGITHSSVIHSCKTVLSQLETKEPTMLETYKELTLLISMYYKNKYGKDLPQID